MKNKRNPHPLPNGIFLSRTWGGQLIFSGFLRVFIIDSVVEKRECMYCFFSDRVAFEKLSSPGNIQLILCLGYGMSGVAILYVEIYVYYIEIVMVYIEIFMGLETPDMPYLAGRCSVDYILLLLGALDCINYLKHIF